MANLDTDIKSFSLYNDDEYLKNIWESLKCGIQQIQKKTSSHLSFEEMYRNAYTIVLHKQGEILYNDVSGVIVEHLVNQVRQDALSQSARNFLHSLSIAWNDHQTTMCMIRDVLMYVDRVYVTPNNIENIYNLGLILFRQQIVEHWSLTIQEALLDSINHERHGEIIDRLSIKTICQMLITLGLGSRSLYETIFESQFLIESVNFYKMESEALLAENCVSVYIKKAEQRIKEEIERVQHYLEPSTEVHIVAVVEDQLIKQQIVLLMEMENSGVCYMLKHRKLEDLACMYTLVDRVHCIPKLISSVCSYLREQGKILVSETDEIKKDPLTLTNDIINLKDYFSNVLNISFQNDQSLQQMFFKDFAYIINLNPKFTEYLCSFIDAMLKKDIKGMTEQDIEDLLDKVIVLFKYLEEKDLFERYYKEHLAKRLLLEKVASDDAEKSMISKLQTECGFSFTVKFEGMFRDMHVSRSIIEDFNVYTQACEINLNNIDLSVSVLTAGIWPMSVAAHMCNIAPVAMGAFESFRRFYLAKHSGRVLTLQPQLGCVEVSAIFYNLKDTSDTKTSINMPMTQSGKKYILLISTYQMCILFLFNKRDTFTYQEIADETNIPETDLRRSLQSLATGKVHQRILEKNSKTKEIKPNDVFSVNDSFVSRLYRIKVRPVTKKTESASECSETQKKVQDDRKHNIEAAIVRIMKSKRTFNHNALVAEVIQQLIPRFRPRPDDIKKRIEGLIEREYLERTPGNRKIYNYLS